MAQLSLLMADKTMLESTFEVAMSRDTWVVSTEDSARAAGNSGNSKSESVFSEIYQFAVQNQSHH